MPTENDYIDVHDLFVSINPNGLDQSELVRDGASFVEPQTINDYHLFRAGYEAALEARQGQGEPLARYSMDQTGCEELDPDGHWVRYEDLKHANSAEVERLRAENARLGGLKPEGPPRPTTGNGLPRYGLRWNGPQQPIAVPMEDGYWTPWHLADRIREDRDGLLEAGAHTL